MIKLHTLRRALIQLGLLAALIGQASWATAGTLGGIGGIITDAKPERRLSAYI